MRNKYLMNGNSYSIHVCLANIFDDPSIIIPKNKFKKGDLYTHLKIKGLRPKGTYCKNINSKPQSINPFSYSSDSDKDKGQYCIYLTEENINEKSLNKLVINEIGNNTCYVLDPRKENPMIISVDEYMNYYHVNSVEAIAFEEGLKKFNKEELKHLL